MLFIGGGPAHPRTPVEWLHGHILDFPRLESKRGHRRPVTEGCPFVRSGPPGWSLAEEKALVACIRARIIPAHRGWLRVAARPVRRPKLAVSWCPLLPEPQGRLAAAWEPVGSGPYSCSSISSTWCVQNWPLSDLGSASFLLSRPVH